MSHISERRAGGLAVDLSYSAFPLGTEILSLAGALPVEALYPGDRVITRDGGAQVLVDIQRHDVPEDLTFLRVSKDALGGKPSREVLLPSEQRLLLRDWRAQALFGTPQARVPLSRLVDGEFVAATDARPEALLTLHFAHEHIVYADGLELFSAARVTVDA